MTTKRVAAFAPRIVELIDEIRAAARADSVSFEITIKTAGKDTMKLSPK